MICKCGKEMEFVDSEEDPLMDDSYFYCEDCDETIYLADLPENHPERLKHQEELQ